MKGSSTQARNTTKETSFTDRNLKFIRVRELKVWNFHCQLKKAHHFLNETNEVIPIELQELTRINDDCDEQIGLL